MFFRDQVVNYLQDWCRSIGAPRERELDISIIQIIL